MNTRLADTMQPLEQRVEAELMTIANASYTPMEYRDETVSGIQRLFDRNTRCNVGV